MAAIKTSSFALNSSKCNGWVRCGNTKLPQRYFADNVFCQRVREGMQARAFVSQFTVDTVRNSVKILMDRMLSLHNCFKKQLGKRINVTRTDKFPYSCKYVRQQCAEKSRSGNPLERQVFGQFMSLIQHEVSSFVAIGCPTSV